MRKVLCAALMLGIAGTALAQIDPSKTKDNWIAKGLTPSCVQKPTGILSGKLTVAKDTRAAGGRYFILEVAPCVTSVKKCAIVFEMPAGVEKSVPAFADAAKNGSTVQAEWKGIDPVWDPGRGTYMPDLGSPQIRVSTGNAFICLPIGWPVIYDDSDDGPA